MNRHEAEALFSEAFEGQLEPDQQRRFDAALKDDAQLRTAFEDFSQFFSAARQAGESAPDREAPDLLGGVQDRLFQRSRGRFYRDRFARHAGRGVWLAAVAMAVVLIVAGLTWFSMHHASVELPLDNDAPAQP